MRVEWEKIMEGRKRETEEERESRREDGRGIGGERGGGERGRGEKGAEEGRRENVIRNGVRSIARREKQLSMRGRLFA